MHSSPNEALWLNRWKEENPERGCHLGFSLALLARAVGILSSPWSGHPVFSEEDYRVLVQAFCLTTLPELRGALVEHSAQRLPQLIRRRLEALGLWQLPAVECAQLGCGRGEGLGIRVVFDGGFGDALLLGRYLPRVLSLGWRVEWVVAPPLEPYLKAGPLPAGLLVTSRPQANHWPVLSLLALPLWLARVERRIPPPLPWTPRWRAVQAAAEPRLGLVWEGSVYPDPERSLSWDGVEALLEVPGVRWVNLQVGARRPLPDTLSRRLSSPPREVRHFGDTASILAGLDGCVTVDTATAHLAGSMGVPTWVLLRRGPSWIWGREQDRGPWYPSIRLVRQPREGDWVGAVAHWAEIWRGGRSLQL